MRLEQVLPALRSGNTIYRAGGYIKVSPEVDKYSGLTRHVVRIYSGDNQVKSERSFYLTCEALNSTDWEIDNNLGGIRKE